MNAEIEQQIHEFANKMYKAGYNDGFNMGYEDGLKYDKRYEAGLNEAWECARKIGKVNWITLEQMGFENKDKEKNPSWDVVMEYSASEAIARIKEYEEKQEEKQTDKIKVGDEVVYCCVGNKYVVTWVNENYINGISVEDGSVIEEYTEKFLKTGKHYSEIEKVLKQMKGENNE